jgi:RimJ/RimL family protein N-acetyltransferase
MTDGRRVRLRPVTRGDYDWLYGLATDDRVSSQWKFRGFTPGPEDFVSALWNGIAAQFVLLRRSDDRPIGLVQFDQFNSESGFGYLSYVLQPDFLGQGWPMEGLFLFVNYPAKDLSRVLGEFTSSL